MFGIRCSQVAFFCEAALFLGGVSAMVGWIFGIESLTTWVAGTVSMKFISALCFVLSAFLLHFLRKILDGNYGFSEIAVYFCSLVIMLAMSSLLLSYFFGVHTGIEGLFVKESPRVAFAGLAGRPALLTIFAFIAIALAGLFGFMEKNRLAMIYRNTGVVVAAIGIVSLLGYFFTNVFLLIEGISPPMAVNTAVLFIFAGICLLSLGRHCLGDAAPGDAGGVLK